MARNEPGQDGHTAADERLLRFLGAWANHLAKHVPTVSVFRARLLSMGGLDVSFPMPFDESHAATIQRLLLHGCARIGSVEGEPHDPSRGGDVASLGRTEMEGYVLQEDGVWTPRRWTEEDSTVIGPEPLGLCYFGVVLPQIVLRQEEEEDRKFLTRFEAARASASDAREVERRIAGPRTVVGAIEKAEEMEGFGRWDEAERWYLRAIRIASGESCSRGRFLAHAEYASFLLRRGRVSTATPLVRDLMRAHSTRCAEDPLKTLLFSLPEDQATAAVRRILIGDVPVPEDLRETVRRLKRRGRGSLAEALQRAAHGFVHD